MPRAIPVRRPSPRESDLWRLQDWPGAVRAGFPGDGLVLKCDLMQKTEMSGRQSVGAAFRVGEVMCGGIGPGQGLLQEGTGLTCDQKVPSQRPSEKGPSGRCRSGWAGGRW